MTGDNVDSAQAMYMVENGGIQRKLPDLEESSHTWYMVEKRGMQRKLPDLEESSHTWYRWEWQVSFPVAMTKCCDQSARRREGPYLLTVEGTVIVGKSKIKDKEQ